MPRPTEQTASLGPEERERCTKGWQSRPCKKRTCTICGLTWAKDWRRVLFSNLKVAGPMVALSAVTPPGQEKLPYDEEYCAHLGPHVHGKRYGCRIEEEAHRASYGVPKRWKRLHNAARNATKREGAGCCLS